MGALLFFLFLFGGHSGTTRHCPELQPETAAIYETVEQYQKEHQPVIFKSKDGLYYGVYYQATTTYELVESEWSDSDQHWEFKGIRVGEKPDLEAIAYNKRVKACQTANGEF